MGASEITYEYEDLAFTVRYAYTAPQQEDLYSPQTLADIDIIEIGLCGKNHRLIDLPYAAQMEIERRIGWSIEEACWKDAEEECAACQKPRFSNLVGCGGVR